jgi:hypothetical protein
LIANAARVAAFLAEEIEENTISEVICEAVLSQVNELAQDMKNLINDAKKKLNDYAQLHAKEINLLLIPVCPLSPTTTSPLPSYYDDSKSLDIAILC